MPEQKIIQYHELLGRIRQKLWIRYFLNSFLIFQCLFTSTNFSCLLLIQESLFQVRWCVAEELLGKPKSLFVEKDKCKPVLLRFSLAGNLERPLMSLCRTKWRERGYGLSCSRPPSLIHKKGLIKRRQKQQILCLSFVLQCFDLIAI